MKKDEVKKVSLWRQTLRDLRGLHKSFRLWVTFSPPMSPKWGRVCNLSKGADDEEAI